MREQGLAVIADANVERYDSTKLAAQAAGSELRSKGTTDIDQIDDALVAMKQAGAKIIIIQPSPFTYTQRGSIITSAKKIG